MISYLHLDDEKIIGNNIIDINELRLNNKSFVDAFQIFEKIIMRKNLIYVDTAE